MVIEDLGKGSNAVKYHCNWGVKVTKFSAKGGQIQARLVTGNIPGSKSCYRSFQDNTRKKSVYLENF